MLHYPYLQYFITENHLAITALLPSRYQNWCRTYPMTVSSFNTRKFSFHLNARPAGDMPATHSETFEAIRVKLTARTPSMFPWPLDALLIVGIRRSLQVVPWLFQRRREVRDLAQCILLLVASLVQNGRERPLIWNKDHDRVSCITLI